MSIQTGFDQKVESTANTSNLATFKVTIANFIYHKNIFDNKVIQNVER